MLPRNSVKEELKKRNLALTRIKGWPLPIRLKLLTHRDKREFQALAAFLELASRELRRMGAWEAPPTPENEG